MLLVLADAANKRSLAWPSQATIAAKAGLQPRHVRNALTALRRRGLITPLGHDKRRRVHRVNHPSQPMSEGAVVGTLVPKLHRHPSSVVNERSRHASAGVTPAISDQNGGIPVPTNPKEPPGENPESDRSVGREKDRLNHDRSVEEYSTIREPDTHSASAPTAGLSNSSPPTDRLPLRRARMGCAGKLAVPVRACLANDTSNGRVGSASAHHASPMLPANGSPISSATH